MSSSSPINPAVDRLADLALVESRTCRRSAGGGGVVAGRAAGTGAGSGWAVAVEIGDSTVALVRGNFEECDAGYHGSARQPSLHAGSQPCLVTRSAAFAPSEGCRCVTWRGWPTIRRL